MQSIFYVNIINFQGPYGYIKHMLKCANRGLLSHALKYVLSFLGWLYVGTQKGLYQLR